MIRNPLSSYLTLFTDDKIQELTKQKELGTRRVHLGYHFIFNVAETCGNSFMPPRE